jgi:hypothetical protein
MIELNYAALRSDDFRHVLSKLSTCDSLDHKVAYRIMRITKELERGLGSTQKEWISLLEKYVEKDGTQWKLNEERTDFVYLENVDKDVVKAEINEFGEKKILVDRHKLKLTELDKAGLSAADLAILEPLVCFEGIDLI